MSEEQRHNCSANKDIKTLSQFAPSNKLAKTSQRDKSSRSGASSSRRPVSGAEGDQSRQQERLGADALETLARRSEGRTAGEKLATMILCARRKVSLRGHSKRVWPLDAFAISKLCSVVARPEEEEEGQKSCKILGFSSPNFALTLTFSRRIDDVHCFRSDGRPTGRSHT